MKWTSANSSDRKSVFYTSEDANGIIASAKELRQQQQQQPHQKSKGSGVTDNSGSLFTFKMGVDEETTESVQNFKSSSKSGSIERNNGADLKRYLKNFMLFSNLEIESEKKCRDEQLSKIVKALMLFEKKLRKEQEIIQQQLCEKDRVINRQMHTISNMKVRLGADPQHLDGDDATATTIVGDTAEFCPMCRKKYYLRAAKSTATQTSLKGFASNISGDDYSSIQSVEYMSSSEEQEVLLSPNPFTTARRSKKYTSKKSYKEYLQSRPHPSSSASSNASDGIRNHTTTTTNNNNNNNNNNVNSNNNNNNGNSNGVASPPKDFLASDKNNNTIEQTTTTTTATTTTTTTSGGKEIGISKSCGGAAKFSLIMNDIHGIKQQQSQQQRQSCDDTHSLKINRMHGISLTALASEKDPHQSDAGTNQTTATRASDERRERERAKSNGHLDEAVARRKKYCDEGLNVKQKIATRDDWYISDVEESDTALSAGTKSPYGNSVSNSVLECVNQILLQQSMDEYIDAHGDAKSKEATPARTNKRVHFSTKNSMVQIKARVHRTPSHTEEDEEEDLQEEEEEEEEMDVDDAMNSTYENQSNYSNEYELIGSSRTYVDMETASSKSSSVESFKPKLPPKPDNLMKLQQIAKQRQFVHEQIYSKRSEYELNESEPDYASISEIQDSIASVKVVTAEIHNCDGDDNEYSEIRDVVVVPTLDTSAPVAEDDSFADVPKLPNVYSIIPGIVDATPPTSPLKKEMPSGGNKCIGHDNYITKSPMKKKPPIAFASIKKEKALADMKQLPATTPPPPVPLKHQHTIKIIDEKIQQEFDWYNLDAEYTKTDIVITPQIENIDEMYQFDDDGELNGDNDGVVKVEYNLEDFEYETVPSSECSGNGIEIETNSANFTTVIKISESHSSASSSSSSSSASSSSSEMLVSPVGKGAATTTTTTNLMELAETPKIDFKKSATKIRYEKFLKESGLISKPILSSKKKFYAAGSFV